MNPEAPSAHASLNPERNDSAVEKLAAIQARLSNTYAMTPAQQGLWMAHRLSKDPADLMVSEVTELTGPIDVVAWKRAVAGVLASVPALRMRITATTETGGETCEAEPPGNHAVDACADVPRISLDACPPVPEIVDLSHAQDPAEAARAWIERALNVAPALHRGVVSHACLLVTGPESAQWFLRVHHLALDGFGFSLLSKALAEACTAATADPDSVPDPTTVLPSWDDLDGFCHAIEALSAYEGSQAHSEDRTFWTGQEPEEDVVPVVPRGLSGRSVRTVVDEPKGGWRIDPVLLLGALGLTVMAAGNKEETLIGVHMMGRGDAVLRETPCTAQNMLPVRLTSHPDESVGTYLDRVSQAWREASAHQRFRQETLRFDREVGPGGALVEAELNIVPFNGAVTWGAASGRARPVWDGPVEGLVLDVRAGDSSRSEAVLQTPEGSVDDTGLRGMAEVFGALYEALTRSRRKEEQALLRELPIRRPPQDGAESTASALNILDRPGPFAHHAMERVEGLRIVDLIRHLSQPTSALRGTTSLVHSGSDPIGTGGRLIGPDADLVRTEASVRTHQLARELLACGIVPGDRVAVLTSRNTWGILAPLAVLEVGAAFVPMDAAWPGGRIRAVIAAAKPRAVVIAGDADRTAVADNQPVPMVIDLDDPKTCASLEGRDPSAVTDAERSGAVSEDAVAYVLFTSGSTGTPKGVVVEHRNLDHFMRTVGGLYLPACLRAKDRHQAADKGARRQTEPMVSVHEHSFAFDSGLSPMCTWLLGHTLLVPSEECLREAALHIAAIREHRADIMDISPAVLEHLLDAGFDPGGTDPVTSVFIGGDACSGSLWDRLRKIAGTGVLTANAYGPTENTVDSLVAAICDHDRPSIGHSLPGQFSLVLDGWDRECPTGFPGQLAVAGGSVSRGYLDRLEETDHAFFHMADGTRAYRTGDLVRRERDGALSFLGRADNQLSLRGVRIEPEEVERALLDLPGVRQAVVAVRDAGHGPILVGYVVRGNPLHEGERRRLLASLRNRLPSAMVPTALIRLEALPLTERGKVDRKQLQSLPLRLADYDGRGLGWADMDPVQRRVAKVFGELLGRDPQSLKTDSDLFALGGHSLTAARLVGRLRQYEGGHGPRSTMNGPDLRSVFAAPTIGEIASSLQTHDSVRIGEDADLGVKPLVGSGPDDVERREAGESPSSTNSLTAAQRRLWFLEQLEGPSALYSIPVVLRFPGVFDPEALALALVDTAMRWRNLHCSFPADDEGRPTIREWRREEVEAALRVREAAQSVGNPDLVDALDLVIDVSRELPLRAWRVCADRGEGLVLVLHHIAADGWSLGPVLSTLAAAYRVHASGDASEFAVETGPLLKPIDSCTPQVLIDETRGDRAASDAELEAWKSALSGIPTEIALPSDRERPQIRDRVGGEVRMTLDRAVGKALYSVARAHRLTPHMIFQGVLAALLTRTGAGTDVPIGTISSNRASAAEEEQVAFVANTLVTRTDTSGNPRFEELFERVREESLTMLERSRTPFDEVVRAVAPDRSPSRHPLFQVMLVSQNIGDHAVDFGTDVGVAYPQTLGTGTAKFDLTCEISYAPGDGDKIEIRFEYASDIFDHQTVEDLSTWFEKLLRRAVEHPESRIGDGPLVETAWLTAENEAKRMLEYRALHRAGESESLTEAIERSFEEYADRVAVVGPPSPLDCPFEDPTGEDVASSGQRTELRYADLDTESARIRDCLILRGFGPGDRAALLVERSPRQVTVMLGCLRAGVAYIPLDPGYPIGRLRSTLEDSAPKAVLYAAGDELGTGASLSPEFVDALKASAPEATFIELGSLSDDADGGKAASTRRSVVESCVAQDRVPRPEDPAYIVFTSGSTGRPKGVVVSQANVLRLFRSTQHWFDFSSDDVWTLFHSFAFDFAVWEMYGALLHGGSVVVVPRSISRSPDDFLRLLRKERVTVLNQTPSAFGQLVLAEASVAQDEALAEGQGAQTDVDPGAELTGRTSCTSSWDLHTIILGGEVMDPAVVRDWHQRHQPSSPQIVNMYGITETTVHVTYMPLDYDSLEPENGGISLVDEPIPDLSVYLLDEFGNPVPDGVVGEIHVGGAGVAAGYTARPKLTAERFVPDPFAARYPSMLEEAGLLPSQARMYRSGDLAVRRRDGILDFRGRSDRQIQLRGFRIEPGEIEAAARSLPDVVWAHVRVEGIGTNDERLVLHVLGPDPATADPMALRRRTAELLPLQMTPSAVVVISEVPLTPTGKLDEAALPAPAERRSQGRPPLGASESIVATCFAETLGLETVSAEDSFFDLGGHSMLAVPATAAICEATGQHLRVGTLMAYPTPELLARVLDVGEGSQRSDADLQVLLPLGRARQLSPSRNGGVFCIHPAGGLSWCYAGLPKFLPDDLPVWGLQARGVLDPEAQPRSLAEMARDYVQAIRKIQPHGPYHLVGWSLGGMVAHVMAAQLQAAGAEVGTVSLLDAYPSEAESGVGEPPLDDAVSAVLAMAGLDDSALAGCSWEGASEQTAIVELGRILADGSSPMAGLPERTLAALVRTYRNTARILREYSHEDFHGDVLFFRAARAGIGPDHDPREWNRFLDGRLDVHDIDCTHREMTQPGPLAQIGRTLAGHIEKRGSHSSDRDEPEPLPGERRTAVSEEATGCRPGAVGPNRERHRQ
ncbi:non-ribosomal peptide synthetase [Rothia uropygioeca]|uniref:non-ribosomal peptide synthetase n=1 Tax=Kocuria sp. 257 TaxID=2021970 RepID=UPI0010117D06|nr:non-ribosomal peptide synthetase [Kocuria sp. 257]